MLRVKIPPMESYDSSKNEFIYSKEIELQLEHSLVSLSKWESKWHKPFLSKDDKTEEEILDYIRCMTLTQNVDPEVYKRIPKNVMQEISDYIKNPMTATTFSHRPVNPNREIITSEVIYYDMVALQIPMECQKWHLNRLFTLINVCSIKNEPEKKMSRNEILSRNKSLNAARRAKFNSKG